MDDNNQPCLQVTGIIWVLTDDCWELWRRIQEKRKSFIHRVLILQIRSKTQSTEVSYWSVLGYTPEYGHPLSTISQSLSLFCSKIPSDSVNPNIKMAYSTHAPWVESFCFPGYHLGFRKHSFMVAGLLPAGPMVINQGSKWYPPLRPLQTLCVGRAAGGLVLVGCFLLIHIAQRRNISFIFSVHPLR